VLHHGSFTVEYRKNAKPVAYTSGREEALITFLMTLLSHLQKLGTVPALDLSAYARVLGKPQKPAAAVLPKRKSL